MKLEGAKAVRWDTAGKPVRLTYAGKESGVHWTITEDGKFRLYVLKGVPTKKVWIAIDLDMEGMEALELALSMQHGDRQLEEIL